MSDGRRRELERTWRETGATDDEAAYLQEKVRVGALAQDRLELAAFFNGPAAVAATAKHSDRWLTEAKRSGAVDCTPWAAPWLLGKADPVQQRALRDEA